VITHSVKLWNIYSPHNHDSEKIIPWFIERGDGCDCEVIYNVYDDVGDIVEWHLDK